MKIENALIDDVIIKWGVSKNSEDGFLRDISKARMFCNYKEDEKATGLKSIYLMEKEIIACSGYVGIRISSDNIPEEFKNRAICKNFEQFHSLEECVGLVEDYHLYARIDTFIPLVMDDKKAITVDVADFMDKFCHKKISDKYDMVILKHDEGKIAVNKKYLEIILASFDSEIQVRFPSSSMGPIYLRGKGQATILMPVYLNYFKWKSI